MGVVGVGVVEADVAVGLARGVSVRHGEWWEGGRLVGDVRNDDDDDGDWEHVVWKSDEGLRGRKKRGSVWGRVEVYMGAAV